MAKLCFKFLRNINAIVVGIYFFYALSAYGIDTITIFGLDLECPGCVAREDGICEVNIEAELSRIDCQDALKLLISNLANSSSYDGVPSAKDMLRFLFASDSDINLVQDIFKLMFATEVGREIFIANISKLIQKYSSAVLVFLTSMEAADTGTKEVVDRIWRETYFAPKEVKDKLQAEIAVKYRGGYLQEIFSSAVIDEFDSEQEQLRVLEQVFRKYQDPLSAEIENLLRILENCKNSLQEGQVSQCETEFFPVKENNLFGKYLESRVANLVTVARKQSLISEIDYLSFSSRNLSKATLPDDLTSSMSKDGAGFDFFLFFGLGFIFIVFIAVHNWKKRMYTRLKEADNFLATKLSFSEQLKFKETMAYFSLSALASETELKSAFRKKATKLHPDKMGGDIQLFNELNERYQSAKALIRKR